MLYIFTSYLIRIVLLCSHLKIHPFSTLKICLGFSINCRSLKMLLVVYNMYISSITDCFSDILKNRLVYTKESAHCTYVTKHVISLFFAVRRMANFKKSIRNNVHTSFTHYHKKTEVVITKTTTYIKWRKKKRNDVITL